MAFTQNYRSDDPDFAAHEKTYQGVVWTIALFAGAILLSLLVLALITV